MTKYLQLFIIAFLMSFSGKAQDSCAIEISLLTCAPGNELYSIFGHSALRIKDPNTGTDIVYNYGTFEFDDPDFYSKFVKGKLRYFLSQNNYADFIYNYSIEGRAISEQFLQLKCDQKNAIQQFIWKNMQEENRYYKYDFLYDNCTTRLRDIIEQFQDSAMKAGVIPQAKDQTFRNALHNYLDKGQMHWSKLGIDLLLGSPIDKKMTNRDAMFLPEYLETAIDSSKSINKKLVESKQFPVPQNQIGIIESSSPITPLVIFSLFSILIITLSFSKNSISIKALQAFDNIFFTTLGLLGCLFVFMWAGTDHKQTTHNYNLLWAWPTHIFWLFIKQKKSLSRLYFKLYLTVSILVLILWYFLPQQLNVSLIPIVTLVAFRSWKNYTENERSSIIGKEKSA